MTVVHTITPASLGDSEQIAEIYGRYVVESTATFESVAPDSDEMAKRIRKVLDGGYPWLVARDDDGLIKGFAYASRFHPREGYRYTCETSIYVRQDCMRQGVGGALMTALIEECEARGYRQALAVIAGTEPASIVLHARMGYRPCGTMENVGRKHGKWIDVFFMQRALGDGETAPPDQEPA